MDQGCDLAINLCNLSASLLQNFRSRSDILLPHLNPAHSKLISRLPAQSTVLRKSQCHTPCATQPPFTHRRTNAVGEGPWNRHRITHAHRSRRTNQVRVAPPLYPPAARTPNCASASHSLARLHPTPSTHRAHSGGLRLQPPSQPATSSSPLRSPSPSPPTPPSAASAPSGPRSSPLSCAERALRRRRRRRRRARRRSARALPSGNAARPG